MVNSVTSGRRLSGILHARAAKSALSSHSRSPFANPMFPTFKVKGPVLPSDDQSQSQSSEDTGSINSSLEGASSSAMSAASSSGASSAASSFSVINYVGKIHKQSSHRSTGRCRTPYERQVSLRVSRVEAVDETTSSSTASSVDYCSGTGDSVSVAGEALDMVDLDEGVADQQLHHHLPLNVQPHLHHGPRSRRSMSVSSSGCSSSMDDRNCDFSPLGSVNSCRCTSFSISDFDDDGFREDGSVSSVYSVFSFSRSYQPHHPLHHNHQNVPHHPNNTKGLFDIALKTVKLIRRNQELQKRLAQLRDETTAFIESVMSNPENESLRSRLQTTASPPAVVVQK